jgi:predicted PurR-regulated permease PerM
VDTRRRRDLKHNRALAISKSIAMTNFSLRDHAVRAELASHALILVVLAIMLMRGLVPAAFFGMLVYTIVRLAARPIEVRVSPGWARLIALVGVATVIVTALVAAVSGAVEALLHADWPILLERLRAALTLLHERLPESLAVAIPADTDEVVGRISGMLTDHARVLSEVGLGGLRALALCLITGIIASMLAVEGAGAAQGPLGCAVGLRVHRLWTAFRKILFAQAKISTINTLLTGVYLWIALPLSGTHLTHSSLLVIATFFLGFLPVVGNLLSNAAIVLLSFAVSVNVAASSLLFLVAVHKLEYFLNARIVGTEVDCKAWELLCVMLLGETLFGVNGVIAAPILYSWAKCELRPLLEDPVAERTPVAA